MDYIQWLFNSEARGTRCDQLKSGGHDITGDNATQHLAGDLLHVGIYNTYLLVSNQWYCQCTSCHMHN